MRFKEFYMPVSGKPMAESLIKHAERIGYQFTNNFSDNPTRIKFYSKGMFSIVDDSVVCGGEQYCWYKFFDLTPEDVRVEPEKYDCRFQWRSETTSSTWSTSKYLTESQVDQIRDIMNEGES